jgi:hypothetical protein
MKKQQAAFANVLNEPAFNICQLAGELQKPNGNRLYFYPFTYGENFRLLFVLAAVIFAGMFALNLGIFAR